MLFLSGVSHTHVDLLPLLPLGLQTVATLSLLGLGAAARPGPGSCWRAFLFNCKLSRRFDRWIFEIGSCSSSILNGSVVYAS